MIQCFLQLILNLAIQKCATYTVSHYYTKSLRVQKLNGNILHSDSQFASTPHTQPYLLNKSLIEFINDSILLTTHSASCNLEVHNIHIQSLLSKPLRVHKLKGNLLHFDFRFASTPHKQPYLLNRYLIVFINDFLLLTTFMHLAIQKCTTYTLSHY